MLLLFLDVALGVPFTEHNRFPTDFILSVSSNLRGRQSLCSYVVAIFGRRVRCTFQRTQPLSDRLHSFCVSQSSWSTISLFLCCCYFWKSRKVRLSQNTTAFRQTSFFLCLPMFAVDNLSVPMLLLFLEVA